MLRLRVDLWKCSLDIDTRIIDNITRKSHNLPMTFDTGAYMTSVDSSVLAEAGYNLMAGKDAIVEYRWPEGNVR